MDTLSNHHSVHCLVATTLSSSEILYFQDGELLGQSQLNKGEC